MWPSYVDTWRVRLPNLMGAANTKGIVTFPQPQKDMLARKRRIAKSHMANAASMYVPSACRRPTVFEFARNKIYVSTVMHRSSQRGLLYSRTHFPDECVRRRGGNKATCFDNRATSLAPSNEKPLLDSLDDVTNSKGTLITRKRPPLRTTIAL